MEEEQEENSRNPQYFKNYFIENCVSGRYYIKYKLTPTDNNTSTERRTLGKATAF